MTDAITHQAYGRHGYRHGLKNLRPNRVLVNEPSYRRGYLRGQCCRIAYQLMVFAAFAFAAGVIWTTL